MQDCLCAVFVGANKYRAQRTPCDEGGTPHWHDSRKERDRCVVLTLRAATGEITDLQRHRRWPLRVNGQLVAHYEDDFSYRIRGQQVVEDVKSAPTRRLPIYRLKRRLLAACYALAIVEV